MRGREQKGTSDSHLPNISRLESSHVDLHVSKTQSTWTSKIASYVISPVSWCAHTQNNQNAKERKKLESFPRLLAAELSRVGSHQQIQYYCVYHDANDASRQGD